MVVARIYKGYKIKVADKVYEVLDSFSMRGKQKYTVKDLYNGKLVTLVRDDIMQAQKDGDCVVYL